MKIKLNKRVVAAVLAGAVSIGSLVGNVLQWESSKEKTQIISEQSQKMSELFGKIDELENELFSYHMDTNYVSDRLNHGWTLLSEPFQIGMRDGLIVEGTRRRLNIVGSTDSKYRIKQTQDGKFLVDANDENKIYLSNFDEISSAFYYKYYDPAFGGTDSTEGYTGYLLTVYDENKQLTLVDLDTFEIKLADFIPYDIDIADFARYYNTTPFLIEDNVYYIDAYDSQNGGIDMENAGSGYALEIYKDGKRVLVDANDLTNVIAYDYEHIGRRQDENGTWWFIISYKNGNSIEYKDDEIKTEVNEELGRSLTIAGHR